MEEYTIYCVQSGLGKTWVCKKYPGWFDLDWHPYEQVNSEQIAFDIYSNVLFQQLFYGYTVAMTLKWKLIERLLKNTERKYKVVLVLADPSRKDEIIGNVAKRGKQDAWAIQYDQAWDNNQAHYKQFIRKWQGRNLEYVYLQKGEFFEDFLKKRGVI